jgi:hypothetical protein
VRAPFDALGLIRRVAARLGPRSELRAGGSAALALAKR